MYGQRLRMPRWLRGSADSTSYLLWQTAPLVHSSPAILFQGMDGMQI